MEHFTPRESKDQQVFWRFLATSGIDFKPAQPSLTSSTKVSNGESKHKWKEKIQSREGKKKEGPRKKEKSKVKKA